jgi:hypothetical protein
MSQIVFVVVAQDRHTDDELTVCATRARADQRVEEIKASYAQSFAKHGDTWTEREYGRSVGWVRYVDSHDDGPKIRIEEHKVVG